MKHRNGVIELFRFIFAISIVIFHVHKKFDNVCVNGNIGVSYFFVVSGAFMAKNIMSREPNESVNYGLVTWKYFCKRISAFVIPYYLLWTFNFVFVGLFESWGGKEWISNLINDASTLLFLDASGFSFVGFIGGAWYISSMLLSILIIYPFLLKFREWYVYSVAPVVSAILLGLLSSTSNALGSVLTLYGPFTKGLLWGIMGFNLGIFCYGVSLSIIKNKITNVIWEIIAICSLAMVIYFAYSPSIDSKHGYLITILIAIFLTVELNHDTLLNRCLKRFSSINGWLGKLSLYVFLDQMFVRNIWRNLFVVEGSLKSYMIGYVIMPIIFGVILMYICDEIKKCINRLNKVEVNNIDGR